MHLYCKKLQKAITMKIRVYYEDTDMGGIVYHTNYIKYCERARSERFFQAGVNPGEGNCHFVVKDINAHYLAPAKFGDLLHVKVKVLECKKVSCVVRHEITRDDKMLFWADITLAYVCNGKPTKIHDEALSFLLSEKESVSSSLE